MFTINLNEISEQESIVTRIYVHEDAPAFYTARNVKQETSFDERKLMKNKK